MLFGLLNVGSPEGLVAIVAVFVAAVCGGALFFRQGRDLMEDRRHALDVGEVLSKMGLTLIPAFLRDIGVGDYVSACHKLKLAAKLFNDPKLAAAEFDSLLDNMIDSKLKDPTLRQAFLDDLSKRAAASAPAPSPAPTAKSAA